MYRISACRLPSAGVPAAGSGRCHPRVRPQFLPSPRYKGLHARLRRASVLLHAEDKGLEPQDSTPRSSQVSLHACTHLPVSPLHPSVSLEHSHPAWNTDRDVMGMVFEGRQANSPHQPGLENSNYAQGTSRPAAAAAAQAQRQSGPRDGFAAADGSPGGDAHAALGPSVPSQCHHESGSHQPHHRSSGSSSSSSSGSSSGGSSGGSSSDSSSPDAGHGRPASHTHQAGTACPPSIGVRMDPNLASTSSHDPQTPLTPHDAAAPAPGHENTAASPHSLQTHAAASSHPLPASSSSHQFTPGPSSLHPPPDPLEPPSSTHTAQQPPSQDHPSQQQLQLQQQQQQDQPQQDEQRFHGIPQPILVISFVSASLTLASCVFNTLLPVYMLTELRMDMRSMGVFEGALEAFSYLVRMCSGVVSDCMTSRKSAITLGFAMGAMAKFGMSGATEVGSLFAAKAMDRLANGVQAAPRDALISDLAPPAVRSACFGFAQSMRKWGSAVGAVLAYCLMRASGNNYRMIFTLAATAAAASCVAFVVLVPSHRRPTAPAPPPELAVPAAAPQAAAPAPLPPPAAAAAAVGQLLRTFSSMGHDYFRMLLIVSLYCLGNIGESLLEARAMEVGFGKAESTLVVATLAGAIFLVAYPLGRLDDKYGPRVTLAVGMAALIATNLVLLASTAHPWTLFASLLLLAVHYGVIQGPLLSIVVGLAPAHLRGTAFGIFYTCMALTAVVNNSVIGSVWHSCGALAAFGLSAAMTTLSLLALPWLLPKSMHKQARAGTKPALA